MTYKRVYCTICKTNHQMTKVKNGWYCIAKNHKQRSGKFIVYWQKPDYALSDFEEYLKAIRKKSRLCIHCNQPIENIRLKHAKYCKYCAEKIWKEQTKYVRKIKLLEK